MRQNAQKCASLKTLATEILLYFQTVDMVDNNPLYLKGTAALMITMLYMEDLNKPCILILVSSKSVEKRGSCGRLNICNWTVMEAAIL